MVKLKRQHFDIQGAAEFLELSVSDVEYYLKEGELRYAIAKKDYKNFDCILLEELPDPVKSEVKGLPMDAFLEVPHVEMSPTKHFAMELPEFLYIEHSRLNQIYRGDEGQDLWSFRWQTFAGEEVTLWLDNLLFGRYLQRVDETGHGLESRMLSREELERFAEKLTGESTPLVVEEASQDEPFKLPQVTNDIAEAMCEYGNRYFREHSKIPKPAQLRNYMLEHGSDDLKLTYDSREKEFSFGGERLSDRQFKYRRSMYLNNSAD